MPSNATPPLPERSPDQAEVLVRLDSIVDPLPVASLFERPAPLELELGSGDGGFLLRYARRHPERNFLGVERLLGRIRKLERKVPRLGLTNVRGLRIEATYLLQYLLPKESVRAVHVYFPDPWPKKRHRSRRLVNALFPSLASRILHPSGLVFLRTDDTHYFEQMQEVFGASPDFVPADTPPELAEVLTDFEQEFLAQGKTTLRVACQKRALTAPLNIDDRSVPGRT
jgi:tRNA (guanine-N7-)-methyltransferase